MKLQLPKGGPKAADPDDLIEAAIQGLCEDKSDIDGKPVYRVLAEDTTKPQYDRMMRVWIAYKKRFPDSDPRNMETMKHFAETVGRSTKARLDKALNRPTVKSIRVKMRTFMSAWERETDLSIPREVHDSMCLYIQNVLRYKIPLSIEEKAPTFLTIENYVHMQEQFWQTDYHNYVHEGIRVYLSCLLNVHCYTSARLQEICMAKYKDLQCMVGWENGEPDIKLSFKRDLAKGMQDTPKKPKHPLYERLRPTPPLFANSILFLLAIFISHGAFRDFKTIWDILAVRPPQKEKYRILEWADHVLNDPVFPEVSQNGPTGKAKNKHTWGHQYSNWANRANFVGGMGLHAARREELVKVDDGGHSLGQVMKFAGHRNSKTLVGHYLCDMSNVDGAAAFLGLEPRRDITEDFRSASMGRNPGLLHSLPANILEELEQRDEYVQICREIESLSLQIQAALTEEARYELKTRQNRLYYQRRKLRDAEVDKYKKSQRRVYDTHCEVHEGDWRRGYFDRVIRHMIP